MYILWLSPILCNSELKLNYVDSCCVQSSCGDVCNTKANSNRRLSAIFISHRPTYEKSFKRMAQMCQLLWGANNNIIL